MTVQRNLGNFPLLLSECLNFSYHVWTLHPTTREQLDLLHSFVLEEKVDILSSLKSLNSDKHLFTLKGNGRTRDIYHFKSISIHMQKQRPHPASPIRPYPLHTHIRLLVFIHRIQDFSRAN